MAAATQQGDFMSQGQQYSLILHATLLVLLIFGLPNFLHKQPDSEPMAISVEILPVAPVSNVKPQEKVEQPKEKKIEAEKNTDRKAHVEASKAEAKPEEKPEQISAKEIIKKLEKKQEKPVKKPKDDLDSILKSVEESAKTEESKKPTQQAVKDPSPKKAESQNYNSALPMTLSEKDAIGQQIARCWSPDAGAKDASKLAILLHITANPDGSITKAELANIQDKLRYNSDSFFRAAADRAMRAVRECSPLKNLPPDKYGGSQGWGDMEFYFDPSKFS